MKATLTLPAHIFQEYRGWGAEQDKPARTMMTLVLTEIAERRIRDRKAAEEAAMAAVTPPKLVSVSGAPLSSQAAALILPAKQARIVPLKRKATR